jgi:photosystem II stability/assembly factor-like uncharacterized protein
VLLARLRRGPDGRPGAAALAVCGCVAAVLLAGCGSGSGGGQAGAGASTLVTGSGQTGSGQTGSGQTGSGHAGSGQAGSGQAGSGAWRAENSGTGQRLYDVACLSALRCEAVGAAGTIVATADGGRTWRAQADPLRGSATALYAIACVAPSSCYVIGRPDTILVTHDGGASWSREVLPVGVSGADLTDQACLPAYTPIAGRPALCRLGLLGIGCASAAVCAAVATAPPAYAGASPEPKDPQAAPSSIWLTRDGGTSWTRQSIPPGVACNGDCDAGLYGYPLEWVSCLSSGLCRAGGGAVCGGHCGFAYALLVTRGPGQPWACVESGPTCGGGPDAADCPTSSDCYGIQSTNPFGPGISVLGSTDGGEQWGSVGPGQGWSGSVLNAIACPAALTCYLAGSGGSVARITGGTTVAAQHTPTARDLYGIGCAGPATCYAVGDDGTILALG